MAAMSFSSIPAAGVLALGRQPADQILRGAVVAVLPGSHLEALVEWVHHLLLGAVGLVVLRAAVDLDEQSKFVAIMFFSEKPAKASGTIDYRADDGVAKLVELKQGNNYE